MDTYNITIKVRKRSDLDVPSNLDEAITMVTNLLQQGVMLEVISVEPEGKQNKSLQWG
jgi:exosome complex RNA-binding protein Csl4